MEVEGEGGDERQRNCCLVVLYCTEGVPMLERRFTDCRRDAPPEVCGRKRTYNEKSEVGSYRITPHGGRRSAEKGENGMEEMACIINERH